MVMAEKRLKRFRISEPYTRFRRKYWLMGLISPLLLRTYMLLSDFVSTRASGGACIMTR